MGSYNYNVEPNSVRVVNTITPATRALPFYCLEAGMCYAKSGFYVEPDLGDCYWIGYTFSGNGLFRQGATMAKLEPGSCIIADCRTSFRYEILPGSDLWGFRWHLVAGVGVEALVPYVNANSEKPRSVMIDTMQTQKDMDRIQLVCNRGADGDDLIICIRIHSILWAMTQAKQLEEMQDEPRRDDVFNAAYYIQEHYTENIDIAELAEHFCLSKFYFVRLFKKYFNTTPYDFLLRYRIERAKEMLCTTQTSVGEIGYLVGFNSESNFSVQFTKMTGKTPSVFRKENYRDNRDSKKS